MIRFATAAPSRPRPVRFGAILSVSWGLLLATCAEPSTEPARAGGRPTATSAAASVPAMPEVPAVTAEQAALYRRAFPQAAAFRALPIPSEMIRSVDQGNETYVEARDKDGLLLGFLRDFRGEVTIDQTWPTKPLDLALAFDAEHRLLSILPRAPIHKRGGAEMSGLDLDRLVALAKDPPEALQKLRRVDAVVDATTGATQPDYHGHVVANAGLTTARIVLLARDTERILQAAPRVWDRRRLQKVMIDLDRDDAGRAAALAALMSDLSTPDSGVEAYRAMVGAYIAAQRAGAEPNRVVETRLITPRISAEDDAPEALAACYGLVNAGVRLPLADRCGRVVAHSTAGVDPAAVARLSGSLSYLAGDATNAIPELRVATDSFGIYSDPMLHFRFADALAQGKQLEESCAVAKSVFLAHPLLTGVKKLLVACSPETKDVVPVIEALRREAQERLLATRVNATTPVPVLPLEDDQMNGMDVELFEAGKVSVVVFFSSWCPHCQTELPRIATFHRMVGKNAALAKKVRLLVIRTAIEQETEPWEAFKERLGLSFEILTDPVMALAFSKFAKSQGVTPGLPTVAIVDERGYVQYFLPPGDFRDTVRELHWLVEDVLSTPAPAPAPEGDAPAGDAAPAGATPEATAPAGAATP